MRTWKWMLTSFLLITLSAMAQQSADQSSTSNPVQASSGQANAAASQPASAPAPTAQPAASQPANPASGQPAAAATAPPTTMDQVVDRTIVREHALMDMLKSRTPLV